MHQIQNHAIVLCFTISSAPFAANYIYLYTHTQTHTHTHIYIYIYIFTHNIVAL